MLKIFKFILIFNILFWCGCAETYWSVKKTSGKYLEIGWVTCYQTYSQDHSITISIGHDDGGHKKLAIDCQKLRSSESFRLHTIIVNNQCRNISLFHYTYYRIQEATFDEHCQYWQRCFIKKLPKHKMFTKLPLSIQKLIVIAVKETDKKFKIHNYQNR